MNLTNNRLIVIISISIATIAFFSSCQKTEIVVPSACFSVDNIVVEVGDSVVFTNCSVADETVIYFTSEPDAETWVGNVFSFESNDRYTHVFEQSGTFIATVRASNYQPGSPIVFETEAIIVN